jgi:pimeloyl-ACP methyl ester carboxylesterase
VPASRPQRPARQSCRDGPLAKQAIGRAHLVGHSFGAYIALQVALDAADVVQSLALPESAVATGPVAEEFVRVEVGPAFAQCAAGDRAGAIDLFMRVVGGPEYRTLIAASALK